MDFEIPEDLKMVQSLVRDFVTNQLKPLERDILGRAADLSDAKMYLPPEKEHALMEMVKEMGLWGVGVPEDIWERQRLDTDTPVRRGIDRFSVQLEKAMKAWKQRKDEPVPHPCPTEGERAKFARFSFELVFGKTD